MLKNVLGHGSVYPGAKWGDQRDGDYLQLPEICETLSQKKRKIHAIYILLVKEIQINVFENKNILSQVRWCRPLLPALEWRGAEVGGSL